MSATLMSSSLVPYKPEIIQPQAPQQSSLSVNTLAVLAKTVYIKADGAIDKAAKGYNNGIVRLCKAIAKAV